MKLIFISFICIVLAACTTVRPDENVFDAAEQAIQAAEAVGGDEFAPVEMRFAREKLASAKKGMEKFPDDQTFDKSIIAYYIKLERTEEAKLALEEALEVEPENSNLWYNLGYLNGETGNYDESVEAYRKAIEVNPNYMDAYINLAFTITEKAKEVRAEAMEMDLDTYQKEGAAIEAKADEYYKQALPVLEKANEITPDDQAILESLSGLYIRLKMTDEAEEVKKKLVSLGYWEDN